MQPARCVGLTPESIGQPVHTECLLGIKATGVRGSSCRQQYPRNAVFFQSPHLGSSGIRHLGCLSPGLGPLRSPIKRRPSAFIWVRTSLARFWTMCIWAAIYLRNPITYPAMTSGRGYCLKKHCFFGKAVSVWTLRGVELPQIQLSLPISLPLSF